MAFVDYDGAKAYEYFLTNTPKTHSDKEEFVKNNAPRLVAGIKMIEMFFENISKDYISRTKMELDSVRIPN